jgi:hypothetical protein
MKKKTKTTEMLCDYCKRPATSAYRNEVDGTLIRITCDIHVLPEPSTEPINVDLARICAACDLSIIPGSCPTAYVTCPILGGGKP